MGAHLDTHTTSDTSRCECDTSRCDGRAIHPRCPTPTSCSPPASYSQHTYDHRFARVPLVSAVFAIMRNPSPHVADAEPGVHSSDGQPCELVQQLNRCCVASGMHLWESTIARVRVLRQSRFDRVFRATECCSHDRDWRAVGVHVDEDLIVLCRP